MIINAIKHIHTSDVLMENFYRDWSDKAPVGSQSPGHAELQFSLEQSGVITQTLTDPHWPSSDLIPISFTFKPIGFCGFSILIWHCLDIFTLRIKCLCKPILNWIFCKLLACVMVAEMFRILRKMPVLNRMDIGIVSYKWTFLSLLDLCRCLCLLSDSFLL